MSERREDTYVTYKQALISTGSVLVVIMTVFFSYMSEHSAHPHATAAVFSKDVLPLKDDLRGEIQSVERRLSEKINKLEKRVVNSTSRLEDQLDKLLARPAH